VAAAMPAEGVAPAGAVTWAGTAAPGGAVPPIGTATAAGPHLASPAPDGRLSR
jgi:hypothetical protein